MTDGNPGYKKHDVSWGPIEDNNCFHNDDCVKGLKCKNIDSDGKGRCSKNKPTKKDGEKCTSDAECIDYGGPYVCLTGKCTQLDQGNEDDWIAEYKASPKPKKLLELTFEQYLIKEHGIQICSEAKLIGYKEEHWPPAGGMMGEKKTGYVYERGGVTYIFDVKNKKWYRFRPEKEGGEKCKWEPTYYPNGDVEWFEDCQKLQNIPPAWIDVSGDKCFKTGLKPQPPKPAPKPPPKTSYSDSFFRNYLMNGGPPLRWKYDGVDLSENLKDSTLADVCGDDETFETTYSHALVDIFNISMASIIVKAEAKRKEYTKSYEERIKKIFADRGAQEPAADQKD